MPGTHLLPPNLLKLFAPRPPLPYIRPLGKDPDKFREKRVDGIAEVLARIKEEETQGLIDAGKELPEGMEEGEEPVFTHAEETKRQMRREARQKTKEERFKNAKEIYKPAEDPNAAGDPYKTLFVSRLPKVVDEDMLRKAFKGYGVIERVRIVRDEKKRSRRYGFIVFERERDMKAAYKEADGLRIMDKPIMVDVERGRTVRGWLPRRLGGGLGGRPKPPEPAMVAAREVGFGGGGFRDGPRDGFRGGFRGGGGGGRGFGRGGGRGGGGFGGGFGDRAPDRGYGGRGGGGGGFRGGFDRGGGGGGFERGGPPRGGGFGPRDEGYGSRGGGPPGPGGFGGNPNFSGGYRGRGGGIGYQGGGFSGGEPNGAGGGGGGYGGPPGGGGGGYGMPNGGYKRESNGYDTRELKRPRY